MKQTKSWPVQRALKHIQKSDYAFLLERGYEIVSVEDADVGWQALLQRADLFVKIIQSRGDDSVYFRTDTEPPEEWFELENVVYAATGEKIPIAYGSEPAKLLQKYCHRIETYFAEEFVKNPGGLRAIQEAARVASWAAYQETLSKVQPIREEEAVPAKESKRIPILYYPLMGIILLLLFGAFTTLYMALLDRVFAAFSPESESYGLFIGAGAVLLAIGTMLLFRRRTKKG